MTDATDSTEITNLRRRSVRLPRLLWFVLAMLTLIIATVGLWFGIPIYREHSLLKKIERGMEQNSQQVTMVKQTSPLGLSIVCPVRWSASSEGQWWLLEDVEAALLVSIYTCTVEGTGSIEEFRDFVAEVVIQPRDVRVSTWEPFPFLSGSGQRSLALNESDKPTAFAYIVYVAQDDLYYYALCVRTARIAVQVNVGFYDGVAQTLCGIGHEVDLSSFKKRIGDDRCAPLGRWASLTHLNLDGTHISDAGLRELKSLQNLQVLNVAHTAVTDAGLVHLEGMKALSFLDLGGTKVSDDGLAFLKPLANLTGLSLHGARITDAGLQQLSQMENLELLGLEHTKVTDAGLAAIPKLTRLQHLGLDGTVITDVGLSALADAATLEGLGVSHTQITDEGLRHLRGLSRLSRLDVSNTAVSDRGLIPLSELANLKSLWVDGTNVTDTGIADLERKLPELKVSR